MAKDKFVVIQEWMLDYGLSTKELMTYATIYGFSQDGNSAFYGGQEYLAKWTKSSIRQIQRVLDKLFEKGFLQKKTKYEENRSYCVYKAVVKRHDIMSCDDDKDTTSCHKDTTSCHKDTTLCRKTHDKMAVNNKEIIKDNKEKERENSFAFSSFNSEYIKQLYEKWSGYNLLNRGQIEFFNRFSFCSNYLKNIHSEEVFTAIDNYKKVVDSNGWYAQKHNFTFESFCKNINSFLPGNFAIQNYCDSNQVEEMRKKEEAEKNKYNNANICPACSIKKLLWIEKKQIFQCDECNQVFEWEEVIK